MAASPRWTYPSALLHTCCKYVFAVSVPFVSIPRSTHTALTLRLLLQLAALAGVVIFAIPQLDPALDLTTRLIGRLKLQLPLQST